MLVGKLLFNSIISTNWDYKQRKVHLSMPGYIKAALLQFAIPAQTMQKATVAHTIWHKNTVRNKRRNELVEMLRQEQDRHTAKTA